MDNVTHTLIGVGLARSLPRRFQRPSLYWASVLGNNMPDIDVPILKAFQATRIDSLIHHRGYTHTLLLALPLGLIVAWVASKLGKEKLNREIVGMGILACVFHVAADYMNSYGVHPFAPFWSHWIYGDSLFIVEPWLWFALLPLAFVSARHLTAKILWAGLFAFMTYLIWTTDYLVTPIAVGAMVWAAVCAGLQFRFRIAAVGVTAAILAIATFFSTSAIARGRAADVWHKTWGAQEKMMDQSASPDPANPFCFRSWIASDAGSEYRYRYASISLLSEEWGETVCPAGRERPATAQITPLDAPAARGIRWEMAVQQNKAEFELVREKSCKFRRMLGFFRFPFLKSTGKGEWIAGDLRYDRARGGGFSESTITLQDVCDHTSQPWVPPFGDGC